MNHTQTICKEEDSKLCHIEIKKTALPDKRLTRVFGIIDKFSSKLGSESVLCMAEQLSAYDKNNLIIPIWII